MIVSIQKAGGKLMNIEWYKPKTGKPYISITKYRINFSKRLIEDIGQPKHVQLGYSDETKQLVIKPLPLLNIEDNKYSIKITGGKHQRIVNRGFIRFLLSNEVKIEDKARKYIATWNEKDSMCYVDLKS